MRFTNQYNSYQPVVDRDGKIMAVLAPPPNDISYQESTKRSRDRMLKERSNYHFDRKDLINDQRGDGFFALNVGLSYGQGHTKPMFRDLGRFHDLADSLLGDVDIQRLASYQDGKSILHALRR